MFLRNGWYAALWSHELTDQPVGKTFLNDKVVLFRTAGGKVGALEDCCCHRAAPLSLRRARRRISRLRLSRPEVRRERPMRRGAGPDRGAGRTPRSAAIRCTKSGTWSGSGWAIRRRPIPRKSPTCPGCPTRSGRRRRAGSTSRPTTSSSSTTCSTSPTSPTSTRRRIAGDPREATTPTKTERLDDGVRVGRWMIDFVPPPLFAKAGNFTEQRRSLAVRDLASAGHRSISTSAAPRPAPARRRATAARASRSGRAI